MIACLFHWSKMDSNVLLRTVSVRGCVTAMPSVVSFVIERWTDHGWIAFSVSLRPDVISVAIRPWFVGFRFLSRSYPDSTNCRLPGKQQKPSVERVNRLARWVTHFLHRLLFALVLFDLFLLKAFEFHVGILFLFAFVFPQMILIVLHSFADFFAMLLEHSIVLQRHLFLKEIVFTFEFQTHVDLLRSKAIFELDKTHSSMKRSDSSLTCFNCFWCCRLSRL